MTVVDKKKTSSAKEWRNRQKLLLICSRGISYLGRHLSRDLTRMMPHLHSEPKLDTKKELSETMRSIAETRLGTTGIVYFEMRRRTDLYMWIAGNYPAGPTLKFALSNVHTLQELRLSGNCLRASRPLLIMDGLFDENTHMRLVKEVFVRVFSTPDHHPHSQPFIDHAFAFKADKHDRIWFRNYQIVSAAEKRHHMAEIGPRFCMQLILITDGFFGGKVIYKNANYSRPVAERRSGQKRQYGDKIRDQLGRKLRTGDGAIYDEKSAAAIADHIFKC